MQDLSKIAMAQAAQQAGLAIVFTDQAIRICSIEHDFPRKAEVQKAAADHLLRVFVAPPEEAIIGSNGQ